MKSTLKTKRNNLRAILRKSVLGLTAATMLTGVGGQVMAAGDSPMMEQNNPSSTASMMAVAPTTDNTGGHSIFTQGKNAAKSVYQAAINHPYKTGALVIGAAAAYGLYAYAKTNNYDTTQMMESAQKGIETFWSELSSLGQRATATVGGYDTELSRLNPKEWAGDSRMKEFYGNYHSERYEHLKSIKPLFTIPDSVKNYASGISQGALEWHKYLQKELYPHYLGDLLGTTSPGSRIVQHMFDR